MWFVLRTRWKTLEETILPLETCSDEHQTLNEIGVVVVRRRCGRGQRFRSNKCENERFVLLPNRVLGLWRALHPIAVKIILCSSI